MYEHSFLVPTTRAKSYQLLVKVKIMKDGGWATINVHSELGGIIDYIFLYKLFFSIRNSRKFLITSFQIIIFIFIKTHFEALINNEKRLFDIHH